MPLMILTIILAMFPVCYGGGNLTCAEIKPCTCNTSDFKVHIDCHGKGLNSSFVCGICVQVKHVQVLDVGANGLTDFPDTCFEDCTELEELYLDSNNLSDITKDIFTGLTGLKSLHINNNSLIRDGKIHDPELFKLLELLEELYIQNNWNRSDLESGTYLSNVANGSLDNLQELRLDGVPNGCFGPNFQSFRNLSIVIFSGSTIFNITNNTFKNTPHIQTLDISYCNLTNIEAGTFEPLKELRFLNLSNNMGLGFPTLRNVSYGLRHSKTIEVLDYSKVYKTFGLTTQLNRCDLWYLKNTTLKEIHLNSNRMASVELNALHLSPSTLETIFVEDNRITFGPFAFQVGCVTNLKRLELNRQQVAHAIANYNNEMEIIDNKIDSSGGCKVKRKTLKPGCRLGKHKPLKLIDFTFPSKLKSISYSNSNLRYQPSFVSSAIQYKNNIESIDFSYNILYKWSDPLILFNDLKLLNLSHNFCFNMTSVFFGNCPNLENFDASYNRIAPILENDIEGSIFKNVPGLKVLNLSACWIEKLPEMVFKHLSSLEHLDLSYNLLEKLEFRYQHMNNISSISLRSNMLSAMPLALLEHLKKNAKTTHKNISIDLSGNILDAENCKHLKFLSWLLQYPMYFTNINAYIFKTDNGEMSFDKLKYYFNEVEKRCDKTYEIISISASLFILVSIVIIIGGIIYRYRWRLRYFYYMTKARYAGYAPLRNPDTDRLYEYDVFISYAENDYQFVTGEMYNKLKESGLSLCLHQKDFIPGRPIGENIAHAVRNSKITLVVLSPEFLESKWCMYEFNMARMEGIYSREGENVICVLMYKAVNVALVSPEMRECFESESYSSYPNTEEERPYFWQMLIRAVGGQTEIQVQ